MFGTLEWTKRIGAPGENGSTVLEEIAETMLNRCYIDDYDRLAHVS